MSTYFDKKKLLDDNSDLYISEFDKALPVSDLGGIIEAKKDYKKASDEGDLAGMKAANDKANNIRETSGGYLGGADGSERIAVAKPYEIKINQKYVSPYEKDKNRVLGLIADKGEFSYNPDDDPVFAIYKSLYTKLGDDAYDRALSEGALRMGGVVSTSAQSAAMQAKNRYNSMIAAKIPELYDSAYKRYESEYERLYNELELYTKLDDSAYQKHRDLVSDWQADRDYFYKKDEDAYDDYMDRYKTDSEYEYKLLKDADDKEYRETRDRIEDKRWQDEFDYKIGRDEIEDKHWQDDYDYRASRDAAEDAKWRQDFDYRAGRDLTKDEQWQTEFDYRVGRDEILDERWAKEFEYDISSDLLDDAITLAKAIYGKTGFSVSTVKNIMTMLG